MRGDWRRTLLRVAGPLVPAVSVPLAYGLGAARGRSVVIGLVLGAGVAAFGYICDRWREGLAAQDARFAATLDVTSPTLPVPRYADVDGTIDAWVATEEDACLASLRRAQTPAPSSVANGLRPLLSSTGSRSNITAGHLRRLQQRQLDGESLSEDEVKILAADRMTIAEAAGLSFGSIGARYLSAPDERSPAEYRAEVSTHLVVCRQVLEAKLLDAYVGSGEGLLRLTIRNPTERVFKDVVVVVRLPGGVEAFDPRDLPSPAEAMPNRPKAFDTRSTMPGWDTPPAPYLAGVYLPRQAPTARRGPTIDTSESTVTVTYPSVSLRPGLPVTLDDVHLRLIDPPGSTITATWTATSPTAQGAPAGTIQAQVSIDPLDVRLLIADLADNSDSRTRHHGRQ